MTEFVVAHALYQFVVYVAHACGKSLIQFHRISVTNDNHI